MTNYQRLMDILKKWPIRKDKGDRDYGNHLRTLAKAAFPTGDVFEGNQVENLKKFDALIRLSDNKYGKKFARYRTIGASGLTIEQLRECLSESFVNKYFRRWVQ